jgi:hypothetical protein
VAIVQNPFSATVSSPRLSSAQRRAARDAAKKTSTSSAPVAPTVAAPSTTPAAQAPIIGAAMEGTNMATTVQNPFDTQQSSPGSAQAQSTGSAATNYQQFNPVPDLQFQTYNAQMSQIDRPTETVAGQIDSILAKDSPLMQRARTLATQQMAQRGLVNSSMAQGAGVAAMVDRATPIAQQDADTFSKRALFNTEATNQANQFNVGEGNKLFMFGQDVAARFGLQRDQQQFTAEENRMDRSLQTALQERKISADQAMQLKDIASREGIAAADRALQQTMQANQFNFQGQQSALDRQFQGQENSLQREMQMRVAQLQESGATSRQAQEIASREALARLEQQGINNRFDKEIAMKSAQFNAEQINRERLQIMENDAAMERLGLQLKSQERQVATNFAASISNTTMAGINAVMADPNMSPEAKEAAMKNITGYANGTLDWGETFFATEVPPLPNAELVK